MIQKLQWKFVLINMTIVTTILLFLGTGVMLRTSDSLRQNSIAFLYRQATEDSVMIFPDAIKGHSQGSRTPYFSIMLGVDGSTVVLNNSSDLLENNDQLTEIVQACTADRAEVGILPTYQLRYLRLEQMLGWYIIFADISHEQAVLHSLLVTELTVGALSLLAFFVISVLLARWATKPVAESWKQQRQFVSDASHELKTPLTVILSNVDMLQSCGANLTPREQRWLEHIRGSSEQMTELVEELLTLARSDNLAKKDYIRESVNLSDLVTDEVLLFEPILFEADKELVDNIAEDITVTGDPSKLKRVVEILLDNARKYAEPHSTVTLRLAPEGQKQVCLSVNTKGEPIPKDALPHLFERFYRTDDARTSEGFGLGLSIAAQIAAEHGGRIWAESSCVDGNTFFFTVPR